MGKKALWENEKTSSFSEFLILGDNIQRKVFNDYVLDAFI